MHDTNQGIRLCPSQNHPFAEFELPHEVRQFFRLVTIPYNDEVGIVCCRSQSAKGCDQQWIVFDRNNPPNGADDEPVQGELQSSTNGGFLFRLDGAKRIRIDTIFDSTDFSRRYMPL